MKKQFTLFLFGAFLFITATRAQPVLTNINSQIIQGETFNVRSTNAAAPGNAGLNQTWDLSSQTTIVTSKAITVVHKTNTPNHTLFPSATLALSETGGAYTYFKTSSNMLEFYGVNSSTPPPHILTNPQIWLKYPLNFNDTFSDTYAGTLGAVTQTGTSTVVYDGFGTLILPNDTITDVARLKITGTYINETSAVDIDTFNVTEYQWRLPNNHYPIARIISTELLGSPPTVTAEYMMNIIAGIDEKLPALREVVVYPNPTTGSLHLRIPETVKDPTTVHIYNLNGSLASSSIIPEGSRQYIINIGQLPVGPYFVHLRSGSDTIMKQIIKQ